MALVEPQGVRGARPDRKLTCAVPDLQAAHAAAAGREQGQHDRFPFLKQTGSEEVSKVTAMEVEKVSA